jgi:hypothetical protein
MSVEASTSWDNIVASDEAWASLGLESFFRISHRTLSDPSCGSSHAGHIPESVQREYSFETQYNQIYMK